MTSSARRIVLVTGANKGIGHEIARQVAQGGALAIVGARDRQRGQAAVDKLLAEGLDVEFVELDLTREAVVKAAAATIEARHGRLDVLVNNAGIAPDGDGPPSVASMATVREVFDTNFFGVLSVTQAMLPLLRKSGAGAQVINLSSTLGSLAQNLDKASPYYDVRLIGYNASKAALNMLSIQLSQELLAEGIAVNSVCPGYVNTDLSRGQGHLTPAEGAAASVRLALQTTPGVTGEFVNAGGNVAW